MEPGAPGLVTADVASTQRDASWFKEPGHPWQLPLGPRMGSQSTGSGSKHHPQGQLAKGDGEDGGWDGNVPWPLQTGPTVYCWHHSTAQGLRTGVDDLVCQTGGRQNGPC